MLNWFRRYRRRRNATGRLPESWVQTLSRRAPFRDSLDPPTREKLDRAIEIFVAEKNWEGCGGFVVQDEHRVTIAAHAMRMTLGFDEDYFDEVLSILVYPSVYEAETQEVLGPSVVLEGKSDLLGQSWYGGPVILAWSDVVRSGRSSRTAQNVVIHEFAHQLDMRNGSMADGVPVIESRQDAERWLSVTDRDFDRLCDACRRGKTEILDCYGASDQAEFFAVASEAFFEAPRAMAAQWPELFELLQRFYRQPMIL